MFKSSKNVILAAGFACILAIGACGCSASVEQTTTTEISTSNEDGTTTTTTTEVKSTASTEGGVSTSSTTQTDTTLHIGDWTDAWMGTSDKSFKVFYTQAPEGTNQALLAIYNPTTKEMLSCVGSYTVPSQDEVVIEDDKDGGEFRFFVVNQTDETTMLQLGDVYGIADLKKVEFDEFTEALQKVDVNHEVLSE